MTKKQKKLINSRRKGNNYERTIGKKFREWLLPCFEISENPKEYFIRTPGSGSWSRYHCPGEDLVTPKWFPLAIELKNRNSWDLSSLVKGLGEVWTWWEETKNKVNRKFILVFTKNYEQDWILMEEDVYKEHKKTNKKVLILHLYIPKKGNFVLMPLESFFKKFLPKSFRIKPRKYGRG